MTPARCAALAPPADRCPACKGVGMAWQWRTYGDQQYHGDYYERCDACDGTGRAPTKDTPNA